MTTRGMTGRARAAFDVERTASHNTSRGADRTALIDHTGEEMISDDELLFMARQGNVSAFGALYARYSTEARRYAAYLSRLILGRDCSDDVTAEAVRKMLSALHRGHGPAVSFRQYLRTAIRSVTMEMNTVANREVPLDDLPEREAPAADGSLDTVLGMRAFQSLPTQWQRLLWTDMVDEIPPREVAPTLGTTPQHVALMTFRAREAFRIAYVRAHFPDAANDYCRTALDLLARAQVVELSSRQQRVVSTHLESCRGCRRAQAAIHDEIKGWSTEGWSPRGLDHPDDTLVPVDVSKGVA